MKKKEKIIVTSGEFDFFDYYTLQFLKTCKAKGDWLIVGLHSDMFLELCRGGYKHTYDERLDVLSSLTCVDEVLRFNDGDGTVCNLLKLVKHCYPMSDITFVSDIDMHNMPETKIRGITFETIKQEQYFVGKTVSKIRKIRDFDDDYGYKESKAKRKDKMELKRFKNYNPTDYMDEYDSGEVRNKKFKKS